MRLARRIARLVAFFLFASAAAADADCGWVLWLKTEYDAALEAEWTIVQALETRQPCIATLQDTFKVTLEKAREAGKANEEIARAAEAMERAAARGTLLVVGRGQMTIAKCLPDTIDPRGPKR